MKETSERYFWILTKLFTYYRQDLWHDKKLPSVAAVPLINSCSVVSDSFDLNSYLALDPADGQAMNLANRPNTSVISAADLKNLRSTIGAGAANKSHASVVS